MTTTVTQQRHSSSNSNGDGNNDNDNDADAEGDNKDSNEDNNAENTKPKRVVWRPQHRPAKLQNITLSITRCLPPGDHYFFVSIFDGAAASVLATTSGTPQPLASSKSTASLLPAAYKKRSLHNPRVISKLSRSPSRRHSEVCMCLYVRRMC